MLSVPDMMVLGAAALLFFGPEQLPRVARKAGNVMREIQNTSQSFIRELERAADVEDAKDAKPYEPPPYEPVPYDATAYDVTQFEPPAPEPEAPDPQAAGSGATETATASAAEGNGVSEMLADGQSTMAAEPAGLSESTEAAPQADHAPHL